MRIKRCPADCKANRELFVEGSKQRKGIFHDSIGTCCICGAITMEDDLK